jgi:hypothetical protein
LAAARPGYLVDVAIVLICCLICVLSFLIGAFIYNDY